MTFQKCDQKHERLCCIFCNITRNQNFPLTYNHEILQELLTTQTYEEIRKRKFLDTTQKNLIKRYEVYDVSITKK